MIRRSSRREDASSTLGSIARAAEVKRLRRKVAQLEAQLVQASIGHDQRVLGLCPDLVTDTAAVGFAAAWVEEELKPEVSDAFFSAGHPDVRARRWLLASN